MNAYEFIKQYGLDLAHRDIACLESGFITEQDFIEANGFKFEELRRVVGSHELVESLGGLNATKELLIEVSSRDHIYAQKFERPVLEKAIVEVEACQ